MSEREILIHKKLDRLPGEEKRRAYRLFELLEKITNARITSFLLLLCGFILIIVVPSKMFMDGTLPGDALCTFTLIYVFLLATVTVIKKLYIRRVVKDAKDLLSFSSMMMNYKETLKTLRTLDDYFLKTIDRFVYKATI